jgi:hypothetical protein
MNQAHFGIRHATLLDHPSIRALGIELPAFFQRSFNWGVAAVKAAGRRVMVKDSDLLKAREALKLAKRALREAERRYDRQCGVDAKPLIRRIRVAEARVQAARAALYKFDPESTE